MEQISQIQWVDTSHSQAEEKVTMLTSQVTLNKTVKLLIEITHKYKESNIFI